MLRLTLDGTFRQRESCCTSWPPSRNQLRAAASPDERFYGQGLCQAVSTCTFRRLSLRIQRARALEGELEVRC